ncbi:MAG: nuclear transport factor 2 family protein [Kribbellaceae bacterium]|nr:nuclear transport factor 2 family protein [Kribbellaceae bacterium]
MDLTKLGDRAVIADAVTAIFESVDDKAWDECLELFDTELVADFSSLNGGEPATITREQLVAGWRAGLHDEKESLHLVGAQRIALDGDQATATFKGYAYNALDERVWEVWGAYMLGFRRTEEGWKCAAITFDAWRTAGDDAVRTHTQQESAEG